MWTNPTQRAVLICGVKDRINGVVDNAFKGHCQAERLGSAIVPEL